MTYQVVIKCLESDETVKIVGSGLSERRAEKIEAGVNIKPRSRAVLRRLGEGRRR